MASKYVFVTGGVVSGLGKGITAASLGRLLKCRGLSVSVKKLDPYLNIDPGTMNPIQHGEVFVTDDGAETDLDLGHYERFIDISLSQNSSVTSGKVYWNVLQKERNGDYNGGTVQVIPHITDEIKRRIALDSDKYDVHIIEIGGTVGDIEGLPFLEAIRQFSIQHGRANCLFLHVTLVPYIAASQEMKTKPTQHSVKELLSLGIQPDIIVCRAENQLSQDIKDKIALFCNVQKDCVIANCDVPLLYEAPLVLEQEGLAHIVCRHFGLDELKLDLTEWTSMVEALRYPKESVTIALVGKYIELRDAYLSIAEALKHGGIPSDSAVNIKWIDSEKVTWENAAQTFCDVDGILVPGGFGKRGIDGKIAAARYARENKLPYLGICLGMQVAVIEFARNVLGYADANSSEIDPTTTHPIINLMPDQLNVNQLGGTMRRGKYPCVLDINSKAYQDYGEELIYERHRHRYELNNDYREEIEKSGIILAGISPDKHIVEMIEIADHPWFVGCQFHPEFKSRPNRPHPLFRGLIAAALKNQKSR
ncbi:MAG TPA: CTP synthase [Ruminococcaceae bacterium]|nr:CTP synthase [Oscillospiraceae bacterium]HCA28919.1 CTP synthase [Oscillospiraceae bacterium]